VAASDNHDASSEVSASSEASTVSAPSPTTTLPETSTGILTVPAPLNSLFSHPAARSPQETGHKLAIRAVVVGKVLSQQIVVPSKKVSVGDALLKMGIKLGPLDRVQPEAKAAAYHGMKVRVTRVDAPLRKRVVAVPAEKRYQPTAGLRAGRQQVLQAGRAGAVELTERVWMIDGKPKRRELVSRRVMRRSQPQLVGLGARAAYVPGQIPYHKRYARSFSLSSRAGSPRDRFLLPRNSSFRPVRSITLVATGYSPDPRENGGYTTTATGLPIGYGAAAVDPRVVPLGTKMYVEGYGYAFACDVGGAIKGRRIDLAYDSYSLANTKGRKKVRVWILAD
jgi:3D (Asp-Asp-Asp) domain-containing protein